jgi:hypothetical protein
MVFDVVYVAETRRKQNLRLITESLFQREVQIVSTTFGLFVLIVIEANLTFLFKNLFSHVKKCLGLQQVRELEAKKRD